MSKLETNTIDTISGSTTLTLGGTNATTIAQDAATTVTGFKSTGIDDNATANALTIDSSSNLQFNSGFGSVATAYGVRAWVKFDGIGTLTINGSANVSSVTDSSTGTYEVNFTNNMPDTNYAVIGSPPGGLIATFNQQFGVYFSENYATNTFRLSIRQCDNDAPTFASADGDPCFAAVLR